MLYRCFSRSQALPGLRKTPQFGSSKCIPVLFPQTIGQPRMGRDSIAQGALALGSVQDTAPAL